MKLEVVCHPQRENIKIQTLEEKLFQKDMFVLYLNFFFLEKKGRLIESGLSHTQSKIGFVVRRYLNFQNQQTKLLIIVFQYTYPYFH